MCVYIILISKEKEIWCVLMHWASLRINLNKFQDFWILTFFTSYLALTLDQQRPSSLWITLRVRWSWLIRLKLRNRRRKPRKQPRNFLICSWTLKSASNSRILSLSLWNNLAKIRVLLLKTARICSLTLKFSMRCKSIKVSDIPPPPPCDYP